MLFLYALREVCQSFNTHKLRILSMGFGVSWAVFILMQLLGVGNGFRDGLSKRMAKYSDSTAMYKENVAKPMIFGVDRCYGVLVNIPIKEGRFFTAHDEVEANTRFKGIKVIWDGYSNWEIGLNRKRCCMCYWSIGSNYG